MTHSLFSNSDTNTTTQVDSELYRQLMRSFPSGVHIATTNGKAGRRGLTISASCSLSDSPPTILICLHRQKGANHIFIENEVFALNTLAGHHQELADIFGGRHQHSQEERFASAEWTTLVTGAPVLKTALITLDCQLIRSYEQATHFLLIGNVLATQYSNAETALAYMNKKYHHLPL